MWLCVLSVSVRCGGVVYVGMCDVDVGRVDGDVVTVVASVVIDVGVAVDGGVVSSVDVASVVLLRVVDVVACLTICHPSIPPPLHTHTPSSPHPITHTYTPPHHQQQ